MAKQYAFQYGTWALARLNGQACAVNLAEPGRTRRSLGIPYVPLEAAKNALRAFVDAHTKVTTSLDPTVEVVLHTYLKDKLQSEGKRTNEVVPRVNRLCANMGTVRAKSLTDDMCKSFARWADNEGYARWTVWGDLNLLRSALKWAWEKRSNNLLGEAVHQRVWNIKTPPGRERVLTVEEVDRLLHACDMPHIRLFILLCLFTGQRHAAVCELRWDQVSFGPDREDNVIDFRSGGSLTDTDILNKRSMKGRGVVIMEGALLAAMTAAQLQSKTLRVVEYQGKSVDRCREGFNVARNKAGLDDKVTPHVLRHTAATWANDSGVDPSAIAKMLGHKDVSTTTGVYIHATGKQASAASAAVASKVKPRLRVVGE